MVYEDITRLSSDLWISGRYFGALPIRKFRIAFPIDVIAKKHETAYGTKVFPLEMNDHKSCADSGSATIAALCSDRKQARFCEFPREMPQRSNQCGYGVAICFLLDLMYGCRIVTSYILMPVSLLFWRKGNVIDRTCRCSSPAFEFDCR
jgi:hypothetical protein